MTPIMRYEHKPTRRITCVPMLGRSQTWLRQE
jgi:hypothetical protein